MKGTEINDGKSKKIEIETCEKPSELLNNLQRVSAHLESIKIAKL